MAFVILILAGMSFAASTFVRARGWQFWFGDSEAHLNIARRIVDSRTPGYDQLGTVWLPLPHAIMLPFIGDDGKWRNGDAAAIPMGVCFVVGGAFLFAAVRRIYGSAAAAAAATVLCCANPNLLYLQSTAMTEAVFFACLAALLYFLVRFRHTGGWGALAGGAIAAGLAALTRYEGWFLIPFAALFVLISAPRHRWISAIVFGAIAVLAPLYWLGHNWWLTGDPLEFYRGPYSARAIQKGADYPGRGNWQLAFSYYRHAVELCAGPALTWMSLAGVAAAIWRRAWLPIVFLVLPGVFYVWSMQGTGGTPIFMPGWPWPGSYYNTRYGLAMLTFLGVAAAALVMLAPPSWRGAMALLVIFAGMAQWIFYPQPQTWITWKESQVNSEGRRVWTHEAAQYLGENYVRGAGIVTSFGDLSGILREAGIPLREAFTADNGLPFDAMLQRPGLWMRGEWAIVIAGDPVQTAIWKAPRFGIHYQLKRRIVAKDSPVIEIYRR